MGSDAQGLAGIERSFMRFIVSPAKKMNIVDDSLAWRDLPVFLDRTEVLAEAVRALSFDDARTLWRCSEPLAQLNFERYSTMDAREGVLTPAILAYEGIQYQHLAPQVMTADQLDYLQKHLRILSGFYGVLHPFDGVVPYRLEMQTQLVVAGARNLYEFWGERLYEQLASEASVVVNLASVEYAKAVLPFAQTAGAPGAATECPRVVTCLFGTIDARGRLVQRSTAAKAARGSMMRWCAEHNVNEVEELREFAVAGYRFAPERSDESTLVFVLSA